MEEEKWKEREDREREREKELVTSLVTSYEKSNDVIGHSKGVVRE